MPHTSAAELLLPKSDSFYVDLQTYMGKALRRQVRLSMSYLLIGLCVHARALSNIVVFGDSLTDDGGAYGASALVDSTLDTNTHYPGAPYYEGRIFSSGNPYSVVAANMLDVNFTDYAIGGATSGAAPGVLRVPASYSNESEFTTIEVPSTLEQVQSCIEASNGHLSNQTLYMLFIGANDYINTLAGQANATVEEVLGAISEALETLYQAGARAFHTQTIPYLGYIPEVASGGPQATALANELTDAHNHALAELVPDFLANHEEASLILFNFKAFLLNLTQNAAQYSITDVTTPCYAGAVPGTTFSPTNLSAVCPDSDIYAYWDGVHPTGAVHQLWGQAVAGQLQPYFN